MTRSHLSVIKTDLARETHFTAVWQNYQIPAASILHQSKNVTTTQQDQQNTQPFTAKHGTLWACTHSQHM